MHNWLKQRAPWQIGICVIGIWSLIAIVWVFLLVLLTPPNGSTGGLLMPEVDHLANDSVTVQWLSYAWLISMLSGYLTGRQYRKQKLPPALPKTLIPLTTFWVIILLLAQWYPLSWLTKPHSLDGFLLLAMLSFVVIMPVGICAAYAGLFVNGSRYLTVIFLVLLLMTMHTNQLIVNGNSQFGMVMLNATPMRVQAWMLLVGSLIFSAVFAFLSTNPDIVKNNF